MEKQDCCYEPSRCAYNTQRKATLGMVSANAILRTLAEQVELGVGK